VRRVRTRWLKTGLAATAVVAALAPTPAGLVERLYSRMVYPAIQHSLTPLSNTTSLALFDPLVLVVAAGLGVLAVVRFRRARRWWRALGRIGVDLVVAASVAYLAFLVTWGLNYRRESLRYTLDYDAARVDADSLSHMLTVTADELNHLAEGVHDRQWPSLADLPERLGPAFEAAQVDLGGGGAVPGRPKRSLLSWYFARAAIDGMTDPYLLEVLINDQVLPFERPFVVAHEWGHLAGYAAESEASFLSWLACLRGDPQARYSGWLALFLHLGADVPADTYREAVARLDPRIREDLRAIVARVSRSTPAVREGTREVYDRFLKANRLSSGVKSYDEVVALIVGTRFTAGYHPVRRSTP
jgi:hypothetical protein